MSMFRFAAATVVALALATPVRAQPVEVAPLAAPDYFSTGGRDTGLPADLWRGTSAPLARTVIARLAVEPLSPAAAALARRILATGAAAPPGAGEDASLAGARVAALLALGDVAAGARIASRAPGVERDSTLAEAAAEAALLTGADARACAVADAVGVNRDDIYWLRLRAFCQVRAGNTAAARLTFDLAQAKARDSAFGRMMSAMLLGTGGGGPASLRNGLDLALARALGLDLAGVKAAPSVAAALSGAEPGPPAWHVEPTPGMIRLALFALGAGDAASAGQIRAQLAQEEVPGADAVDLAILDAALAVAAGRPGGPTLDRLVERSGAAPAKARPPAQAAALYLAALGAPMSDGARAEFAALPAPAGKATPALDLAMTLAAEAGRTGETALLALWIAADAGADGPGAADRARIIHALSSAGLDADARAFALEGLLALP